MYPHERSLVKRMQNRPFVLLGINSDAMDLAQAAVERENITWRSWWDGGSTDGPISRQYQVQNWPGLYILDHHGVIRFKDVRGSRLDIAVDQLVTEAEDDSG